MMFEILRRRELRPGAIVAWSIVRDEMQFLPAFLRHHRRLGIGNFIFLDDQSSDGTTDFLLSQDDCMVLHAPHGFADTIEGQSGQMILRNGIAATFLQGLWGLQLDADEFLVLPEGYDIASLCAALDRSGVECCWANMVDFYPPSLADVLGSVHGFENPFDEAPFFDHGPYAMPAGPGANRASPWPPVVHAGLSERLYRRCGLLHDEGVPPPARLIELLFAHFGWTADIIGAKPVFEAPPCAVKMPLVKWSKDKRLHNAHLLNAVPSPDVLLALAHFKFVRGLPQRIERALRWRSYYRESLAYVACRFILDELIRQAGERAVLLHSRSMYFQRPDDLAYAGLMYHDLETPRSGMAGRPGEGVLAKAGRTGESPHP